MWMGGNIPLGYDVHDRKLVINTEEADRVRRIFELYDQLGAVRLVKAEVDKLGLKTKSRTTRNGNRSGGMPFRVGHLYTILHNPLYAGLVCHKGQTYPGEHEPIIDPELWDQVQLRLTANARDRMRSKSARQPSLLKGRLFDEHDSPMTPSHAVKDGKRYRYYISAPLVTGTGQGIRVPAGEIERLVINQICAWLSDPLNLLKVLSPADERINIVNALLVKASQTARQLNDGRNHEQIQLTQAIIKRIVLTGDGVKITLDTQALAKTLDHTLSDKHSEPIQLECKASIKRLGKQTRLVIAGQSSKVRHDDALIKAIVRAHRWFDRLKRREVRSIAEIANAEGLQRTYVSGLMPLAFLAPDLVESIFKGTQPEGVTFNRILKLRPLPMSWAEQRTALGIAV